MHNLADIEFNLAGKHSYQIAFHLDGYWGCPLVPLTAYKGKREWNPDGVSCLGGAPGHEAAGRVAPKRLRRDLEHEQAAGRLVLTPQLNPLEGQPLFGLPKS